MNGTLLTIREMFDGMTKKERLVAEALLRDPESVVSRSITEYSQHIGSSTASVSRFCKKIGISGFSELKLTMAKDLANERYSDNNGSSGRVNFDNLGPVSEIIEGVVKNSLSCITKLGSSMDSVKIEEAASLIASSDNVLLCGVGASGLVAKDLHHKLTRVGILSHCDDDLDLAKVQLTSFGEKDLVIAFSYSGMKKRILTIVKQAHQKGVKVISVTRSGSNTVALLSDINLSVVPSEALVREGATISRLQMLIVVDALFQVLISKRSGVFDTLMNTWDSVAEEETGGRDD
mgnify:CR=1 FL=1|jgi:DNA-binding MurR/RpiR family transcriptional regulator